MTEGKIIKAISGFYYVHDGIRVWTCHALGVFRNIGVKPLVGDNVCVEPVDPEKNEGSLVKVLPRENTLIRPAVANIDQALIVFAIREPDPNFSLLDRFLINMGKQDIPVVIYFNKADIDSENAGSRYREMYEKAGYRVICGSTSNESTIEEIRKELKGKTTVLAGPSGAGKSSLTNRLYKDAGMEAGELSGKLTDNFRAEHPGAPWRQIKGMRNVVAHSYGTVDPETTWEILIDDIPKLKAYCIKIIKE